MAGIALQFVNPPGALGHLAVAASFALLLVFAVLNIDQPGLLLFAVGVSLNAFVVIANGGMPITRDAVIRSDQGGTLPALEAGAGGAKHHLANEDSVLLVLGDVTGVPTPIAAAVSVGDLVLYAGIAWYVAASMQPAARDRQLTSRARNTSSANAVSTTTQRPARPTRRPRTARPAWERDRRSPGRSDPPDSIVLDRAAAAARSPPRPHGSTGAAGSPSRAPRGSPRPRSGSRRCTPSAATVDRPSVATACATTPNSAATTATREMICEQVTGIPMFGAFPPSCPSPRSRRRSEHPDQQDLRRRS